MNLHSTSPVEVVVDDRGRLSLRGLVDRSSIYRARKFADGSIILEPATMPQSEAS